MPVNFLFMPKIGLSRYAKKKRIMSYVCAPFFVSSWAIFFNIVEFTLKMEGVKIVYFRASCLGYFGYHIKGCLSETPLFSLLGNHLSRPTFIFAEFGFH